MILQVLCGFTKRQSESQEMCIHLPFLLVWSLLWDLVALLARLFHLDFFRLMSGSWWEYWGGSWRQISRIQQFLSSSCNSTLESLGIWATSLDHPRPPPWPTFICSLKENTQLVALVLGIPHICRGRSGQCSWRKVQWCGWISDWMRKKYILIWKSSSCTFWWEMCKFHVEKTFKNVVCGEKITNMRSSEESNDWTFLCAFRIYWYMDVLCSLTL